MNRKFVVFRLNSILPAKTLSTFDQFRFLVVRFITLPPLTLTSFKARGVTLKYARLLKINILALDQERPNFVVSKFEYVQCIDSRPVKLKAITMGISSEWYAIFVSYNCID